MYIDIEYLREQCDGQEQMMALLLNTFQQTGPEYIKRMEDSLAAEDYPELRQASHAFLSSLRILGAKEIAADIAKIEDYCMNVTNLDELPELVPATIEKAKIAMEEARVAQSELE